ncbi:SagB/ThcOx family dehydrogenase [Candidatus Calescamantes bacterium]|nr:SagB/ThcOx family dehydrogenase [Candidatus Calescamantes bacterium]
MEDTEKGEMIKLPAPFLKGKISVEEAILRRYSVREYLSAPLNLKEVSQLLWSAQGITGKDSFKRASPSAGATYPLEVYVVSGNVEGLEPGVYKYHPSTHSLEFHLKGDKRGPLALAALGQRWVSESAIDLIFTAVYSRTTFRYGKRGVRYVNMEVGHAAENLSLQCVSLGLGTVMVGAFYDEKVKKVLNLPKEEEPLYILPVGRISS